MVNCAVPSVLLGMSSRWTTPSLPMSVKSFGSFSATLAGTGSLAAASAKRAEGRLATGAGMLHHAARNGDLAWRNLPLLRRRRHEHRPRRGAGLAQLLIGICDSRRAAGALNLAEGEVVVERVVGRRAFDAHLRPIGVELFGDDGGQARIRPLPHLDVLGDDSDGVISADADEGVRREGPRILARGKGQRGARLCLGERAANRRRPRGPAAAPCSMARRERVLSCTVMINPPASWQHRGWPHECGHRSRNGTDCRSSPSRCRRRSASCCRPAAPPRS